MVDSVALFAGLGLLLGGGTAMVKGAASLAQQLGVPPLVIGLTVLGFGTSAPELAVSVTAAVRGDGGVAFGNLIGSNLANVGLILAGSALVRPLAVHSVVLTREIPMMLLASTAAVVMGMDALRLESASQYDRSDGILLLLFFAVFLYYTALETFRKRSEDPLIQQAKAEARGPRLWSLWISGTLVILGIVGLTIGGGLTVRGAVGIATALGIAPAVIGLTVVAVGTSLPELTTSVVAASRGESDLAVGNIVGSNIFNLLFILGVTAVIQPVPVPADGVIDLVAMVAVAAALMILAFGKKEVGRLGGALLCIGYVAFMVWRTL